jgi:hypothetical protein
MLATIDRQCADQVRPGHQRDGDNGLQPVRWRPSTAGNWGAVAAAWILMVLPWRMQRAIGPSFWRVLIQLISSCSL